MDWNVYNQFAWTEHILASPESYEEEAMTYVKVLERYISVPTPTILHLGCGAGGHDFHFKKHFSVTGVDLSEGILEIAKKTNPEITYINGDMRNVKLNEKFDAVIIPDSIMYMRTLEDLSAALSNAAAHLKPLGVLLVVAHTKEQFRNNNFAYTGEDENFHITVLENNHITSDSTYESAMIYLIRQDGELSIEHEVHTLGLFSYDQWMTLFEKLNLKVDEISLNHLYDRYLLEEGEYKLKVFVGTPMIEGEETQLDHYLEKASEYLKVLCDVKPNRRTGSSGNREATDFFEKTIRKYGYDIDAESFATLDYVCHNTSLTHGDTNYEVYASPYSLECDISAEIITVSTVEELENSNCEGKILLMRGAICEEQLAPKNFVFYNPEHHKKIIDLVENHKPGGIITATKKNPDLAGALCPFPLFVDGDFDIPSVYCLDTVADEIQTLMGKKSRLRIDANRIPSRSSNVLASLNRGKAEKIVITAHLDAYESTLGALDNASGTVVLLLVAEMLADYRGKYSVEILALNGEDHYSAAGEMDYLNRYGNEMPEILVVINIDDVGFKQGKSTYSFYECRPGFEELVEGVFGKYQDLEKGEQWYAGDHMVFVQNQVPAIAITSELMPELLKTVTHTSADTPDLVECHKLVEIALAINEAIRII